MTKYPAQIDTSANLPTAVDNVTPVNADLFNRLRDAILAVEGELGVKPSALYTTVRARLDNIEGVVSAFQPIELDQDLGGTIHLPKVIGIQGRPVVPTAPTFNQSLVWNGTAWEPKNTIYPTATQIGQTLIWNGTNYIADFTAQDDITAPVNIELLANVNLVEVGSTITNPAFTASYSYPAQLTAITLKDSINLVNQTILTPAVFASNYSFTGSSFGHYVDFTLTATQKSRFTKSDMERILWCQKVYWGKGAAAQTGQVFIKSLAGKALTVNKNTNFTISAGSGEKIYFACRSAYGDCKFTIANVQGGFTKTQTVSLTNLSGFTENYDLYESNVDSLGTVNVLVSDGLELQLISALSNIEVYGSTLNEPLNTFKKVILTSATTYDAELDNLLILCTTSLSAINISLPLLTNENRIKEIIVKDIGNNASINNIVVTAQAGNNIDGASSKTISTNKGYFRIINDNDSWNVVG